MREIRLNRWAFVRDDHPEEVAGWVAHCARIQCFLDDGDTMTAVKWAGSSHAAEMMNQIWTDLDPGQLREVLGEVWIMSHGPLASLRQRTWLGMFKKAGFVSDGPPQPTEPLAVYRAAETWTGGRGMSWTLDRSVAETFYGLRLATGPTGLYQAVVPPRAVLARLDSRDEAEAIINPNMLRGRIALVRNESPAESAIGAV